MKYRIGVDVGGTNTDAAVIDTTAATHTSSRGVITSGKTPTTPDVTTGIYTIIKQVLADAKIDRRDVLSVAIGTTHFVNAVVQADRRRLSRVAVIRLCGPFTRQVPPWVDFPPTLRSIIEGPVFYLDGGLEIDGREISSLKPAQIKDTVRAIQAAGVDRVAVTGVFSPLDHRGMHEETCKKLMLDFDPTLSVVCSHSIGGIGLLERENATILNASILTLARRTVNAFCQAMAKLQLHCPLYLTQNDGTLTDAATAAELPIRTFASGPTNSMTGAAYLAGLDQGTGPSHADTQILVVDVGGTTSDICGLLSSGFPRQAANVVEVGGVRTAFSMPEVLSIGLGGGSRVALSENSDAVSVGPDSVGHKLTGQALVFGGKVITATDIVVASGAAEIGDPRKVQHLPSSLVSAVRAQIKKLLERAIENMKVSDLPVTLLLVGGGSVMQMDPLEGVAACMIPPHRDSANAVGAAIAKVAGEIDIIEILAGRDEKMVLEGAKRMAMEVAVARGADETDVKIVEVDQIPLQYVTNKATRLVIKAVGKLAPLDIAAIPAEATNSWEELELENQVEDDRELEEPTKNIPSVQHAADIDIDAYRPNVQHGIWYVSPVDLEFIATGTGVLGTGGGGSPRLQYLHSLEYFRNPQYQGKMRIIAPECLADSDVCVLGLWYGAPSVSIERIPAGDELMTAIDFSSKLSGHSHFDAIVAGEIGGGNGLSAFPTSSYYDVPVVDGDLMGRAYPTLAHCTPYVYDHPVVPCVMADGKGNTGAVMQAESHRRVETMLRSQCIDLGLKVAVSSTPLAGDVIKQYAIPNTVSQAWYIGRAIHQARKAKRNIINSIFETTPGKLLYTGKVIHVQRDVSRGYTMGQCTIAPLRDDEKEPSRPYSEETRHLVVPFQNEFLYAGYSSPDNPDRELDVICTVPDLISILGADGEAIGSPELRYGLNVSVIAMAAHPLWTGKQGLRVGGPEGFGMEMAWKSLGEYQKPRSVVEEFDRIPE